MRSLRTLGVERTKRPLIVIIVVRCSILWCSCYRMLFKEKFKNRKKIYESQNSSSIAGARLPASSNATSEKGNKSSEFSLPLTPEWREPREESRRKLGKRLRQQAACQESSRSPSSTNPTAPLKSTRLGSAFQRVSKLKLWQRQHSTPPSSEGVEVSSRRSEPQDDQCHVLKFAEEPRKHSVTNPKGKTVSPSNHEIHALKTARSITNLWKKPLQKFRRPYQEQSIMQVGNSKLCRQDTSERSGNGDDSFKSSDPRKPRKTTLLSTTETEFTADIESPMDVASMADASTMPVDSNMMSGCTPREPRRRKSKKPKHGDDSVLIGLVITIDPTIELLELGKQPLCIDKSKLKELQKVQTYSGTLLGGGKEEEESTEASPSNSDLLGFHLECFDQPTVAESSDRDDELSLPSVGSEKDEEIEIIFRTELPDVLEGLVESKNRNTLGSGGESDCDPEAQIEIVFYNSIDESEGNGEGNIDAHGYTWDEDQSRTSEGSGIPLEWLLPPQSKVSSSRHDMGIVEDTEPPEYEWFLPDHLEISVVNEHSPLFLFGELGLEKMKTTSCTPSTAAETNMSFELHACQDESQGSGDEVLSLGSLPSEAVQSLIDFCQMSEIRSDISRITYRDPCGNEVLASRDITETIRIISGGIDF